MSELITIGRQTVEVTNHDKVLFPDARLTKGDLIAYYQAAAPTMLPYLKDRPLTMQRFPDGIQTEGFYQKEIGDYFPPWIGRATVPKVAGGTTTYVVCNSAATLVYLANQACITPHLWLSKTDKLEYPDRMIFDLDPSGDNLFDLVKKTALKLKKELERYGLTAFAMVTGSRGIHVIVPLKRQHKFDTVRTAARAIADRLVAEDGGKHLTTDIHLVKRKGKIFIDTNRNAYAQTAVAPYAVRALPGAPVATPVTWDEVASAALTPQRFTIKNSWKRLEKTKDLWSTITKKANSLTKVLPL